MKQQTWFEMLDIRRRFYDNAVWIPLRVSETIENDFDYGFEGRVAEIFCLGSLAVPLGNRSEAEALDYQSIGLMRDHRGVVENGIYIPADVCQYNGVTGLPLVLAQSGNAEEPIEWHLHQDFAITLGLKREADRWLRMDEDYIEIARLRRGKDAKPICLEVRASHLKDYLCARGMALRISSYRRREEVLSSADHILWPNKTAQDINTADKWEGHVSEIHEGGKPYGTKTFVMRAYRTDVDHQEDIPAIDGLPNDGNTQSESWTSKDTRRKLFRIFGELWRNEWLEPAQSSIIVRRDKTLPTVFFITTAEGKQESKETLAEDGRWLWFRPEVISQLAHRRGGTLEWYTRDTGGVACSPGYNIHFGVNSLGLINAYAKDIVLLPEWQQKIWSGFNVPPDGKVSEELLASQVDAQPANTLAPEAYLEEALKTLRDVVQSKHGISIVRQHDNFAEIISHSHRFRAIDKNGLYALAKDLARLTADSMDVREIQKIVPPPQGTKWGSLKSLENLLGTAISSENAHALMGPLFSIYDLRLADAHLPDKNYDTELALLKIDKDMPFVFQGAQMIHACVATLFQIAKSLNEPNK